MNASSKIAVVTGSRAEYGLLSHLVRELARRPDVRVSIIATGSHFDPRFGETISEVERDGFDIARRVPVTIAGDSGLDIAYAMAEVTAGVAKALAEIAPDLLVMLGDRYEMLASASAATVIGVPVAHVHGGEITEGAIDDSMRHAITKLAHLHFAAAPAYRDRIVQMGEPPERVHCVGALAVDAIAGLQRVPQREIENRLGIELSSPLLLVTYHPVTADGSAGASGVGPLVDALDRFPNARIVITGVNADPSHAGIARKLEEFVRSRPNRAAICASLGQKLYLSVMALADAVVGNSSSGVIEAPIMQVPSVNVGDRQSGRIMPPSVVCCPAEQEAIAGAIARAITPDFRRRSCTGADFGTPGVAARMADILSALRPGQMGRKRFYDLEASHRVT